jgi:hypothetical protein
MRVSVAVLAGAVLAAAAGCGSGIEPYHSGAMGSGGTVGGAAGGALGAPGGSGAGGAAFGTGGIRTTSGSGGAVGTGGHVVATGGSVGLGGSAAVTGSGGTAMIARLVLPWFDDFEADVVNGRASGWIQDPSDTTGKWAIAMDGTSKVLQEQVDVSSESMIVGGDSAWTDQKIEAKVKFTTVTSSSVSELAARFVDFDNYYFLEFKGDGSMKIRKRISSNTTDVVVYKSKVALVAGTWYTIGLGLQGNVATIYFNGAAVGTMTEAAASLSMGGIALGFKSGSGAFDDVKVTLP